MSIAELPRVNLHHGLTGITSSLWCSSYESILFPCRLAFDRPSACKTGYGNSPWISAAVNVTEEAGVLLFEFDMIMIFAPYMRCDYNGFASGNVVW